MAAQPSPSPDGAAFYAEPALRTLFYDLLYGSAMANSGDLAWYDALAAEAGDDILDAACGTGRVFSALAKPGRRFCAFDASEVLLETARERAHATRAVCPVHLTCQRLEDFAYERRFNLILVAYYRFGNLLDAAGRGACFERLATHLQPGGRVVLHLPAPALLTRAVPEHELGGMRAVYTINYHGRTDLLLEHQVAGMEYDAGTGRRAIHLRLSLKDATEKVLKEERCTMHYACLTADDLRREAAPAGLELKALHTGFKPGPETELVAVFGGR